MDGEYTSALTEEDRATRRKARMEARRTSSRPAAGGSFCSCFPFSCC